MFCPRCATQNELEQNYCRRCGQLLSGARLDLEGSRVKSLEKLKEGEKWIRNGTITLVVFNLIALVVAITTIISTGLMPSIASIIFDLVLGLAIGIPLILVGKSKRKRARYLPDSQDESGQSLRDTTRGVELLTTGLDADSHKAQDSVTEHTTFDLETRERVPRKPT